MTREASLALRQLGTAPPKLLRDNIQSNYSTRKNVELVLYLEQFQNYLVHVVFT